MNQCITCKYWGVDFEGVCDLVDTLTAREPDTCFYIEVKADDDQGLEVRLVTGPHFGCIHYKEK